MNIKNQFYREKNVFFFWGGWGGRNADRWKFEKRAVPIVLRLLTYNEM